MSSGERKSKRFLKNVILDDSIAEDRYRIEDYPPTHYPVMDGSMRTRVDPSIWFDVVLNPQTYERLKDKIHACGEVIRR